MGIQYSTPKSKKTTTVPCRITYIDMWHASFIRKLATVLITYSLGMPMNCPESQKGSSVITVAVNMSSNILTKL